jgi:hypothetical protein
MSSLSSAGRIPPMHAGAVRTAMMLWLCMAAARAEVVATAGGRTIAASRRHRRPNRPPVVAGAARG